MCRVGLGSGLGAGRGAGGEDTVTIVDSGVAAADAAWAMAGGIHPAGGWKALFRSAPAASGACLTTAGGSAIGAVTATACAGGIHPAGGWKALFGSLGCAGAATTTGEGSAGGTAGDG